MISYANSSSLNGLPHEVERLAAGFRRLERLWSIETGVRGSPYS